MGRQFGNGKYCGNEEQKNNLETVYSVEMQTNFKSNLDNKRKLLPAYLFKYIYSFAFNVFKFMNLLFRFCFPFPNMNWLLTLGEVNCS